jgi:hypothetical protein
MARTNVRSSLGAAALVAAVGAAVFLTTTRDATPTETRPLGPSTGTKGEGVWDGAVRFELTNVQCGTGPTGDGDTPTLRPAGMHCWTYFSVLNRSSEPVRLPWEAQRLVAAGEPIAPSRRAMAEIVLDEPGQLFERPLPPGGGGTGVVVFDLPLGAERDELVFHADGDSDGAHVYLEGCSFSDRGGGCYVTGGHEAETGAGYPFTISGPQGGMSLFEVCFDERQWEVTDPYPTAGMPAGFTGHGVMTLTGETQAIFDDNSGATLVLEPTEANADQPGLCG